MNVKSSSCPKRLFAVALNSILFCCDDSGMVTPPCCQTFFASTEDLFWGLGLSNFRGSTEGEKMLRPNKSSSYKPLDSESKYIKDDWYDWDKYQNSSANT